MTLKTSLFEKLEKEDRQTDRQTDGQDLPIKSPCRRLKSQEHSYYVCYGKNILNREQEELWILKLSPPTSPWLIGLITFMRLVK